MCACAYVYIPSAGVCSHCFGAGKKCACVSSAGQEEESAVGVFWGSGRSWLKRILK